MPEPKPRKPRKALLASGLVVLLGAGLAWLDPSYHSEHYASAVGERRLLALADGSQVEMDSGTRLSVSWHLRSRRVELQQGQALFDVSKAVFRPFQVHSGVAKISVLGTRFNVLRGADMLEVALLRGKVAVQATANPAQQLHLAPGQQVRVEQGRLQPLAAADLERITAWQRQRLVFARTPLSQALAQIQRYRVAVIELEGQGLADLSITGTFDTRNVETLLDLLPRILPVSLSRGPDGSVHIGLRVPGS
ncbi:FecR domain-containing protein [Pseudomonas sp. NPDC008258]|uniref:FecR family protein n=1 Tax=Pseudomonas sp. NPDC008258 TaxID=3364418 RepID=UPI0036F01575